MTLRCSPTLRQAAGPMWSGPLHDPAFVADVLDHVEASEDKYGTAARMKGMLTVAKEASHIPLAASRPHLRNANV